MVTNKETSIFNTINLYSLRVLVQNETQATGNTVDTHACLGNLWIFDYLQVVTSLYWDDNHVCK